MIKINAEQNTRRVVLLLLTIQLINTLIIMPYTPKQIRFFAGIAHGMKPRNSIGPSPEASERMLHEVSHKKRSLAMRKKKK